MFTLIHNIDPETVKVFGIMYHTIYHVSPAIGDFSDKKKIYFS